MYVNSEEFLQCKLAGLDCPAWTTDNFSLLIDMIDYEDEEMEKEASTDFDAVLADLDYADRTFDVR